jgi:hypothetical protein
MAAVRDPNTALPDPSNPLEHDQMWKPYSPAQSRKVASMFMASCPSLRQMSFPIKSADDEGGRVDLCYVRSGRAEAALEGFYCIDPEISLTMN